MCILKPTLSNSALPYHDKEYKWHTSIFDDESENFFPAEVPLGPFDVELRSSVFPLTPLEAGLSNGLLEAASSDSLVPPRGSMVPPFESRVPLCESSTCLSVP